MRKTESFYGIASEMARGMISVTKFGDIFCFVYIGNYSFVLCHVCFNYRISRFLENEGMIFDVNKTKKYLGILLRTSFRVPFYLLHCTERRIY